MEFRSGDGPNLCNPCTMYSVADEDCVIGCCCNFRTYCKLKECFMTWINRLPIPYLPVKYMALYGAQDRLLYHPDPDNLHARTVVQTPAIFNLPYENLYVRSLDGVPIHLYLIKQKTVKSSPPSTNSGPFLDCPTIIFFHGNAGNMGHRLHNAAGLYSNLGCNVLMVEYRGYGFSKGAPSEHGLYMDAQAAMDYLLARPDIDPTRIVIFGRSLGGAVAIDLTSRPEYSAHIWCLIVENTFTSIPDMAQSLFGWKCLKYLPKVAYKNKFDSLMKVKCVTVPTLFVSGLCDSLVPPSMMMDLYRNCGSPGKQLVQLRNGSHNDTWTVAGYYVALATFLDGAKSERPEAPTLPVERMQQLPPPPPPPSGTVNMV